MFKDIKHVWNENMRKQIKDNDDIFHVGIGQDKLLYTEPKTVHDKDKKIKDKFEKWVDVESDSNAETDENKKWVPFKIDSNVTNTNKSNDAWVLVADSNSNRKFLSEEDDTHWQEFNSLKKFSIVMKTVKH